MQLECGQRRHIAEQFAVEFLTAKQAMYSVKQFATVEFMIATTSLSYSFLILKLPGRLL